MYCLLHSLTSDFTPAMEDDGSAFAPAVRTFFTFDSLQKSILALRIMCDGVERLDASWGDHARCEALEPSDRVASGLVRLKNGTRSLYASTLQLAYAQRAYFQAMNSDESVEAHLDVFRQINPLLEYNILIGGVSWEPVEDLSGLSNAELLRKVGLHIVGTKSGSNILSFNQALMDLDDLHEIHNSATRAIRELTERSAFMEAVADIPTTVGSFVSVWQRVIQQIHIHSPNPYGVEPGDNYRVGI